MPVTKLNVERNHLSKVERSGLVNVEDLRKEERSPPLQMQTGEEEGRGGAVMRTAGE